VNLADARQKRTEARKQLLEGIDPSQAKKDKAQAAAEKSSNTFEKLAREWHANRLPTWRASTAKDTLRRLELDIFPQIGAKPIVEITHQDMVRTLRKIEDRGVGELAHLLKAVCARVFSYANQLGIENRNPAADMKDVLKPKQAGHFAAITADDLPAFLAAMSSNDARLYKPTRIALRLMLLIFVRTSELTETP